MSEEIKEPTAFFRELGISQTSVEKMGFAFQDVYDDLYKAMLPHIFDKQRQPRLLASIALAFVFDIITTAMAITQYDQEKTFEKDMEEFIATVMMLLNASQDAVGANARLLVDKKSIFNIREKLDS